MHVDTADDRRAHGRHREESVFPRAVIRRPFVQTEQILQPTGDFRIDGKQVSDVVPSPTDLPANDGEERTNVFFTPKNELTTRSASEIDGNRPARDK